MRKTKSFVVSLIVFYSFFINSIPVANACGPFTVDPYFSLTRHADYPLFEFAGGKSGIVPPSYGRMSLFVFYRQLNNLPFTKTEQKQVEKALAFRIGEHWTEDESVNESASTDAAEDVPDYFQRWKAARAKVLNVDVKIPIDKQAPEEYSYYSNCLGDAFNNAAKTLDARISQYGNNDDVKEWLRGQDMVFANCGAQGTTPPEVNANAPDWLKKDRQYQIAAALFYDGKYPEARTAFENIADDKNSVWSKTANFVVARTYIRESSMIDDEQPDYQPTPAYNANANSCTVNINTLSNTTQIETNATASNVAKKEIKSIETKKSEKKVLLDQAETRLKNILNDASMSEFHPSAIRLFGLVMFRSSPEKRRGELAKSLSANSENPNIYNDLTDYVWLLDKIDTQASDNGTEIDRAEAENAGDEYQYDYHLKLRDVRADQRSEDLTDWLITYQASDGFAHAYEKWKSTGKVQWLTAALIKAGKNTAQNAELLADADKVERGSAAYSTVRYHQIRLLLENGKRAEAKQKLDEVFANNLKEFPVSTQNKFYSQRMVLAANLDEFLKYAQRHAAAFIWSDDANEVGDTLKDDKELMKWKTRTMFDADSVAFFNEKMPLSVLRQAALSPQLPEHLKKFLIVAVWTRSIVIGNQAVEREFTPLVSRYAPEYSTYFSKYATAANPVQREAAGLTAILRYPVMQPYVPVGFGRDDYSSTPTTIDSNRGNWWCAEDENKKTADEYSSNNHYDEYPFTYPKVYPNFLTAAQTAEAAREHKQMLAAGNSSTFLTRRAIDFASRNPGNPQTPELLHLAVRSTRYGCADNETSKLSKKAFDILHQRYPRSEWTVKTPYWF